MTYPEFDQDYVSRAFDWWSSFFPSEDERKIVDTFINILLESLNKIPAEQSDEKLKTAISMFSERASGSEFVLLSSKSIENRLLYEYFSGFRDRFSSVHAEILDTIEKRFRE